MINLYLAVACLLLANVNGAHGDDEMMRNLRNGANASLPANPNRFYVLGTGGDISKEHEAEEVTASSGGSVAMTVGNGARKTLVVELPPQANAQGLRNKMEAKGFTLEVDQPLYSIPTIEGDDPGQGGRRLAQSTPWGVLNVFQNDVTPILEENLPEMQHSICIIDSGYEIVHPDLPKDAINADPGQGLGASYPYNRDGCEHGTHVAGTISAIDNDQGVIGVFPGASDMKIVRVFRDSCGWQYSSRLLDAANHCQTAGAKIITMSLGGGSPSTTERDTFDNLVDDGILVIAAAGNNGNSINYPAYYNSIVSVGATDVNDNIASWSTYNDQVDVSAPGVGIESTTGESGYSTYSGTSMATPHVSGIAMLLWNRNPTCTNLQIRHALQETAEDRGDPGRDDKYGHGIIRFHDADAWLLANCPAPGPTPAPVPTPPTPLCGTNPAATPNNDFAKMEKLATTQTIAEVGLVANRAIAFVATAATTGMMLLMVFRVPTTDAEANVARLPMLYSGVVATALVLVGGRPTATVQKIAPRKLPPPHHSRLLSRLVLVETIIATAILIAAAISANVTAAAIR
eukprot:CAMPEP_0178927986 /NCGR_PEP_ID=MMETSP0786-20121207/19570_1 /TAXON_ID=186022 /ORGANISM="Thalassionema frauenfeldii, Strain CCMP 1798" /LENGTH=572 /DNA_ID=CAMNT_0020603635 /DNA_START=35 /DNA_END=1754 /DNA_ORIENTATION=+